MAKSLENATRVNLYVPNDILNKVDTRCDELNLSRSAYVVMALHRQLEADDLVNNLPALLSVFQQAIQESKRINK